MRHGAVVVAGAQGTPRPALRRVRSPIGPRGLAVCCGLACCLVHGEVQPPTRLDDRTAFRVDFRYAPPEWQTAICLPDDPHKTLVDRSGELLYHYGQGGREFGTRIGVDLGVGAVWKDQETPSARVPIVHTRRQADGWDIDEAAFAVTDLKTPTVAKEVLRRFDGDGVNRNWARPPEGTAPALRDIAVHMSGSLRFELSVSSAGAARRIALVLC